MRTGSFNRRLADAALARLRASGATASDTDLRQHTLPLYDGDLEARDGVPLPAQKLHQLFRDASGIFIASPEYNAGISPLVKNTVDWISRVRDNGGIPAAFGGPVFALGGASPGGLGAYRGLMQLRQSLELGLNARVIPQMVAVTRAGEAFDSTGALAPPQAKALDGVIEALLQAASASR